MSGWGEANFPRGQLSVDLSSRGGGGNYPGAVVLEPDKKSNKRSIKYYTQKP